MLRQVLLILALLGFAACYYEKSKIKAIKRLLTGLDHGFYATCNIAFFKELTNFNRADKNCQNFDIGTGRTEKGNLATIDDEDKNKDLQIMLEKAYPIRKQPRDKWGDTRWVWSGLRKTKNNHNKRAFLSKYKPGDWEWADGSLPKNYSRWLKHQPDQRSKKFRQDGCEEKPRCFQNQMRINHKGQWDDTYKFKTHPYACDYQGKYTISAMKKTWVEAKKACADAGRHLAKVRSSDEVEELLHVAEFFLGPIDSNWGVWDANNWIWIGGNDQEEEGNWKWLDGKKVEANWTVPWKPRAGNDNATFLSKDGQDALAISRRGQFDDSFVDHRRRKRPFACQCPGS